MNSPNYDELMSLLEGLPPEGRVDPAVLARQRRAGRTDECPPLADLLTETALLETGRAQQIASHATSCAYCRPWYQRGTVSTGSSLGTLTFREQPSSHALRDEQNAPTTRAESDFEREPQAQGFLSRLTSVQTLLREQRKDEALAFLRPYLELFLRGVGLVPTLADAFERYLVEQVEPVEAKEPILTQWLRGFAHSKLHLDNLPYEPTPPDWEVYFSRALLAKMLREGLPTANENDLTGRFRAEAVRRGLYSADVLGSLVAEFDNERALESYCTELTRSAETQRKALSRRCLKGTV